MNILETDVLERLAARETLLAFDFDGTLAPIVDDPAAAEMADSTRHLLQLASQHYPVAVVSGRSQRDLQRLLGSVTIWALVGNHGLEPHDGAARCEAEVRRWAPTVREALRGEPGVCVEDKSLSVAVHYRAAPDERSALARIDGVTASLGEVRVIRGKKVVNLLPAGAPHKGTAVERLREQFRCDGALYVGDDETDEDVFSLEGVPIVGVHVGTGAHTHARYRLREQPDIDELLRRLVAAREKAPSGRCWERAAFMRR